MRIYLGDSNPEPGKYSAWAKDLPHVFSMIKTASIARVKIGEISTSTQEQMQAVVDFAHKVGYSLVLTTLRIRYDSKAGQSV